MSAEFGEKSKQSKRRAIMFIFRKEKSIVESKLKSIVYDSYLDICIKSIQDSAYVQLSDRYLISFKKVETDQFDFRKFIITEVSLRLKMNFKNMIMIDENSIIIFK